MVVCKPRLELGEEKMCCSLLGGREQLRHQTKCWLCFCQGLEFRRESRERWCGSGGGLEGWWTWEGEVVQN